MTDFTLGHAGQLVPHQHPVSPDLADLLARAKALVDSWTPEQREAHFREQRANMARNYRPGDRQAVPLLPVAAAVPAMPFASPAAPQPDYKAILIGLCAELYMAEGSGDVSEDVWRALKVAGIVPPASIDNDSDLADWLAIEHDAESVWVQKAPGEPR